MDHKKTALFITEERYIDENKHPGGVAQCTNEFINLLNIKFNLKYYFVEFRKDIFFRIKFKLGLDCYSYYSIWHYSSELERIITMNKIEWVFINMTATSPIAKTIKAIDQDLKVILLSHGNESGDFLHSIVRFNSYKKSLLKNLIDTWKLGCILRKEAIFRLNYIDAIFTVSEVEESIEKWLNAKKVYMIPRVVIPKFIKMNPKVGIVGFIGDLSHPPNYYAIEQVAISLKNIKSKVEIQLIGSGESNGRRLENMYENLTYFGYVNSNKLEEIIENWALFLNINFYYSRGVSTKLGFALKFGLPIISTPQAIRGYSWNEGQMLLGETSSEVASLIEKNVWDINKINEIIKQSRLIAQNTPQFDSIWDSNLADFSMI